MLRSVKELGGYAVRATDGEIGAVHALHFEDKGFAVRYLAVNTGNWLSERLVLIAQTALEEPGWEEQNFPVALTREQVKHSPDIDADSPVSRQVETQLQAYYSWPVYWTAGWDHTSRQNGGKASTEMPLLRSSQEVIDYSLEATDGRIGHIADIIVDDEEWVLRYAVVATGDWLPGKSVLVAMPWVTRIDYGAAAVHVGLTRQQIEDSPEYDPRAPINRKYEELYYDYYGRPRYWDRLQEEMI